MKKLFFVLMCSGFFNAKAQKVVDPSLQEDTLLCQSSHSLVDVTSIVEKLFPNHPIDSWKGTPNSPFVFFKRESHGDSVIIPCIIHSKRDSLGRVVTEAWEEIDRITFFYYTYNNGSEYSRKFVYSFNLSSRNPVRWIGQMCSEEEANIRAVHKYTVDIFTKK